MDSMVQGICNFSSRRAVVDPRSVRSSSSLFPCGQSVVGWWYTDSIDMREGVGDNVVLSRDGSNVCCELGNEV
jgi:hypothetical protein